MTFHRFLLPLHANIHYFRQTMSTKRIIPCLDIKDGTTVKGVHFVNFRHAGDPVELAANYCHMGADELVMLDITATYERRKTFNELVKNVAANIYIPLTVGGGISELDDIERLLIAGARKVSINSAALRRPGLIDEIVQHFGSHVCVVAIDANEEQGEWICYLSGGRIPTDKRLFTWAEEAESRGACEILFTSMTHDGVKQGYPNEALAELSDHLHIPVIASGGAGKKEDFYDVFTKGKADAALAASVFHFGEIDIRELKQELYGRGIDVRL
jgi:cyclase